MFFEGSRVKQYPKNKINIFLFGQHFAKIFLLGKYVIFRIHHMPNNSYIHIYWNMPRLKYKPCLKISTKFMMLRVNYPPPLPDHSAKIAHMQVLHVTTSETVRRCFASLTVCALRVKLPR